MNKRMMARLIQLSLCAFAILLVAHVSYNTILKLHTGAIVEVCPTVRNVSVDYASGFTDQMDLGLADYISKQWMIAPSTQSLRLKKATKTDFSQAGQSSFVDKLLERRVGGFYVECGAAEGEALSNTLFFERERNWTGLLIEANPDMFQELRAKQRRAYLLNACLSTSSSTGRLTFHKQGVLGGLESTKGEAIQVQCFPFYPVLLATGRTHVDYFSLDVEGSELAILRTIPFHVLFIDLIGVEYHESGDAPDLIMQKLQEIRMFFKTLGTYKEVGILPWGTFSNPKKEENMGLDILFKHI